MKNFNFKYFKPEDELCTRNDCVAKIRSIDEIVFGEICENGISFVFSWDKYGKSLNGMDKYDLFII